MTITVNPLITPTFTQVDPICNGDVLAHYPLHRITEITGTWSPAIDNTATTTYTFTPDASQTCASQSNHDNHGESIDYSNLHSSRPYL